MLFSTRLLARIGLLFVAVVSFVHAQTPPDAGVLRQQIERQLPQMLPQERKPLTALPPEYKPAPRLVVNVNAFRFAGDTLMNEAELAPAVASYQNRPLDFAALQADASAVSEGTPSGDILAQMIASALQGHPAIQAQQAQERGARAGAKGATWQFYPTPSIAIEKANTRATESAYQGDSTVSTFRLQQPLWTGGRLTAGLKKAEADVLVSQAALEEVRHQLALRVVQAYGDWLSAHLKTLAYKQGLATHIRLRDQVKRRIEQGASSESDLIQAVSRLLSVSADHEVARAQNEIALARLGQLLGRQVDDAALSAQLASPKPVSADPQSQLERALAIHPALHRAQAQAMVQEAVIAERRADLSPEIYLRAERQYGNHATANTNPQTRMFVGLSSRFGAGLSSQSNIEIARAQHQAALAEVDVQSRAVIEQILADHVLAASSVNRLEALNASLEAAGQVSESYDRQFLAGRKTWLDVMNAARELTQTQVQLADIKAAQIVASWRLAIHTQGLAAASDNKP